MAPIALPSNPFTLAAWSSLPDPGVVEALMRAPFDAIVVDMQHGQHDLASANLAISTAARFGKPAIVRVAVADLAGVSRVLDFGAAGVILPMIETAEEARRFVEAAKYPPRGLRSFGPFRAADVLGYPDAATYVEAADTATLTFAMIETAAAYRDLDAILAVEGLDGILVGPSDLSLALTGRLDANGERTIEAGGEIARRARVAGKRAAIYAASAADAERARRQGFDIVGISSDAAILRAGAEALARSVPR